MTEPIKRQRGAQPGHGRQGGRKAKGSEPRVHGVFLRLTSTHKDYLASLGTSPGETITRLIEADMLAEKLFTQGIDISYPM